MTSIPFKEYNEFRQKDPYNAQNIVSGCISRDPNQYYGSLLINKINDAEIRPKIIMGTPKMHYPFDSLQDGTRKYKFPIAKEIEIFEKLDGTNILAFSYSDGDEVFYSYKTRLMPFVKAESRWGNFFSMWNEVASEDFGYIHDIMATYNCNLSFELFGARNPHLVLYDIPLSYALLFGVTNEGNIISPTALKTHLPSAQLVGKCDGNYPEFYAKLQKDLETKLRKLDDEKYMGMEGTVWYLRSIDNRIIQFKCKPETIEAIHFSQGKGISKNVILATCWNALENTDTITTEFIKQLLLEEFDARKVEANHYLIEQCIDIVKTNLLFRDKVLSEYRSIGIDIKLDKASAMRKMSEKFQRNEMGKVYATISNWG